MGNSPNTNSAQSSSVFLQKTFCPLFERKVSILMKFEETNECCKEGNSPILEFTPLIEPLDGKIQSWQFNWVIFCLFCQRVPNVEVCDNKVGLFALSARALFVKNDSGCDNTKVYSCPLKDIIANIRPSQVGSQNTKSSKPVYQFFV